MSRECFQFNSLPYAEQGCLGWQKHLRIYVKYSSTQKLKHRMSIMMISSRHPMIDDMKSNTTNANAESTHYHVKGIRVYALPSHSISNAFPKPTAPTPTTRSRPSSCPRHHQPPPLRSKQR